MDKRYELISTKKVFESKAFSVTQDEVQLPSGSRHGRAVVEHGGAVVILPMDGNRLYLVRQYRHAIRKSILEFPAGTLDKHGEVPLECAKRELAEEVGQRANDWTEIGISYPTPGFCTEIQHFFVAANLTPHKEALDEDELIEVEMLSLTEVESAIRSGEICDGKSMAIFARARLLGMV